MTRFAEAARAGCAIMDNMDLSAEFPELFTPSGADILHAVVMDNLEKMADGNDQISKCGHSLLHLRLLALEKAAEVRGSQNIIEIEQAATRVITVGLVNYCVLAGSGHPVPSPNEFILSRDPRTYISCSAALSELCDPNSDPGSHPTPKPDPTPNPRQDK